MLSPWQILVVATSFILLAETTAANTIDDSDLIAQIQKVRNKISTSAGKSVACETPRSKNCTFKSSCAQFDGKAMDTYLYQNSAGRQVPNLQLLGYVKNTEICLGKPFPRAPVQDPFLYPEQLVDPVAAGGHDQLGKNYRRYSEATDRVNKIFLEAQSRIVKILKARRTSANAAEIDNMIHRVSSIKYWAPKSNQELSNLSQYGCDVPNAGYVPSTHQVLVCPQIMNMPDAALYTTFAHEIGHAIDPCQSAKFYEKKEGGITESDTDYYSKKQTPPKNKIFAAITGAKNPFKEVIICLQKSTSLGAKIPTMQEMIDERNQLIEEAVGLREEISETDPGNPADSATDTLRANHEAQVQGIKDNYDLFKGCYEYSSSGHIQEGFSDWMASQALAQKVSEISETKQAQEYAFESQTVFMAIDCQNINQGAVANIRPLIRERCSYLLSSMDGAESSNNESPTHPNTGRRVSRVMYAPKEMQKALGCQPDSSVQECK